MKFSCIRNAVQHVDTSLLCKQCHAFSCVYAHSNTYLSFVTVWDRDEEDRKRRSEWQTEEEKGNDKEPLLKEQERAEEERRRKDQLLAKMREKDMQAQAQDFSHDDTGSTLTTSQNLNTSILSFTEPHEFLSTHKPVKRGGALTSQKTNQDFDLTFGSYAPSFGKPAPRAGLGHWSPSQSVDQLSGDENGMMDFSGPAKEKKSNLMEQLFGSAALSAQHDSPSKMELLNSPSTKSSGGRRREAEMRNRLKKTTLHVSESGPAVRAITTLDDDIEEVTL